MIPVNSHSAEAAEAVQSPPPRQDCAGGIRGALRSLFPAAPTAAVPPIWSWRVLIAAAEVVAVGLGAAVLLLRVPGLPAWDTVYAEDYFLYLPQALQHPWHVFVPFDGYLELVPRLVAQFVTYLPVDDAAKGFAFFGALIAAGCALFIFHASAGHVRSVTLRVLLAVGVILLSSAPMEIADSGVNTLWYLLLALFWAVLWRPQTRTGIAVAAVVGFFAAASTSLVILFAPLLAIRAFVLRRPREHAVTAGWLAGCLVQLHFVVGAAVSGQSRLVGGGGPAFGRNNRLGNSLTFYLHDVVLRSVGWHLSWWLESFTTRDSGHADRRHRACCRPGRDHRYCARGPAVHCRCPANRLRHSPCSPYTWIHGTLSSRHVPERGGCTLHGAAHLPDRGRAHNRGRLPPVQAARHPSAARYRPSAWGDGAPAGASGHGPGGLPGRQLGGRLPVQRHPQRGRRPPVVSGSGRVAARLQGLSHGGNQRSNARSSVRDPLRPHSGFMSAEAPNAPPVSLRSGALPCPGFVAGSISRTSRQTSQQRYD